MKPDQGFIIFLKNIEEICSAGIIKLDKDYVDFISKNYEIILLFGDFFVEMLQNNKKNTKYDPKKLISLLKKQNLFPGRKIKDKKCGIKDL